MIAAIRNFFNDLNVAVTKNALPDPLKHQEGGSHYKNYQIQPAEFIHANDIRYLEGCAIKYLCRHREKGGVEDLLKAKHYIDIIISLEYKNQI